MKSTPSIDDLRSALEVLAASLDPLEAVGAARVLRMQAEAYELETVRNARQVGASWARIGAQYGLTKQGAQQRFAKLRKREM